MPDMSGERRFQMLITDGAKDDLRSCKREDRWAAAKITEFLREFLEGISPAQILFDERYYDDEVKDITGVWSLQDRRINAYRVRLVAIARWRIITAVDHQTQRVAIMAVMPRDDDYEENRDLWARLEREYDAIGFARYGRG